MKKHTHKGIHSFALRRTIMSRCCTTGIIFTCSIRKSRTRYLACLYDVCKGLTMDDVGVSRDTHLACLYECAMHVLDVDGRRIEKNT